eukprot:GHVU01203181.1.p1 GENE.GHVU01203181.1~~GHVU01203181.1.p1  ORF type:complete len:347 (-),score=43.33 GHVU01203181.1:153-1193(-)
MEMWSLFCLSPVRHVIGDCAHACGARVCMCVSVCGCLSLCPYVRVRCLCVRVRVRNCLCRRGCLSVWLARFSSHLIASHRVDRYAVAWDSLSRGRLATGTSDAALCLWDIAEKTMNGDSQTPTMHVIDAHPGGTHDVAFANRSDGVLCSVGEDGKLKVWDARQPCSSGGAAIEIAACRESLLSASFNCFTDTHIACAGESETIYVFDVRHIAKPFLQLKYHSAPVNRVCWCPWKGSLLLSASDDRRVLVWDALASGAASPDDAAAAADAAGCEDVRMEDAVVPTPAPTSPSAAAPPPASLKFVHAGHSAQVSDCCWSRDVPGFIASTASDNVLQLWMPSEEVFGCT